MKFKLTNKRKKALEKIEEFINPHWKHKHRKHYDYFFNSVKEETGAISAEEAFFNHSERGIKPTKVNDANRYADLMWGLRWLTWQKEQYRKNGENNLGS